MNIISNHSNLFQFILLNSFSSVDPVSDDLGPEEKRGDNDEEGGNGGEENLTEIENNYEKGRKIIIMILIMMSMKIILIILKAVTVLQECPVTTKEATTIMKIKKRLQ